MAGYGWAGDGARFGPPSVVAGPSADSGSILAAQWGHRTSFGFDLQVEAGTRLDKLGQPEFEWLHRELRQLGATARYSPRAYLYTISFGTPPDEQAVQIWAHSPEIKTGERSVEIDSDIETVLSNAQILRGKLERSHHELARDVYDITKAAERDPKALSIATNTVRAENRQRICLEWIVGYGRIANNARARLRGIPPTEDLSPERLGSEGAAAISNAQHRELTIRTEGRKIVIEATAASGHRWETSTNPEHALREFEAHGVLQYLEGKDPGPQAVLEATTKRCADGIDSVVYHEEDSEPTELTPTTPATGLKEETKRQGSQSAGTDDNQVVRGSDQPTGGTRLRDTAHQSSYGYDDDGYSR